MGFDSIGFVFEAEGDEASLPEGFDIEEWEEEEDVLCEDG